MAKISPEKVSDPPDGSGEDWQLLLSEWEHVEGELIYFQNGGAFYSVIGTIADVYHRHEEHWPQWLAQHGVTHNPSKPFRPLIAKLTKGKAGASWATKICGVLDEWLDELRDDG